MTGVQTCALPISLFVAKGRTSIELIKKDGCSLGLTISGGVDKDGKPRVAQLKPGSIAQKADIFEIGDVLLAVNSTKTAGLKHEQVIELIKQADEHLVFDIEYDLPKWRTRRRERQTTHATDRLLF